MLHQRYRPGTYPTASYIPTGAKVGWRCLGALWNQIAVTEASRALIYLFDANKLPPPRVNYNLRRLRIPGKLFGPKLPSSARSATIQSGRVGWGSNSDARGLLPPTRELVFERAADFTHEAL